MHITRTLAGVVTAASPALAFPAAVTSDSVSQHGSALRRSDGGNVPYGFPMYKCFNAGDMALTFDDGPSKWTSDIVRQLDEYGFKATFFVTGGNLAHDLDFPDTEYPGLLRKMVELGHQVGSHTYSHQNMDSLDFDAIMGEMVNNERSLYNILGYAPTYMRPPFAACHDRCLGAMSRLRYHVVQFSIDTKDYMNNDSRNISASVDTFIKGLDKHKSHSGSDIVLAHDTKEWTAKTLTPKILEEIKKRGYRAVTVGECLNDPKENWYRDTSKIPGLEDPGTDKPAEPDN